MNKGLALPMLAILGLLYLSVQTSNQQNSREKLSPIINSEYQEVRPMISADGKTLYFSRRHHPENLGGTADFQDVWMSHLVDGTWSQPTNLGTPINNKKANTLCSMSTDGKYGMFLDSYKSVKAPLGFSELTGDGWRKPKDIEIKDFVNISSYYDFHHFETKGVLIMAINTGRGSGDQDLHVSFLQSDGAYSKPVNLGRIVNSRKADFAPFLAADSKTLFYSSYGHKGHGGSDLYVTQRLDDSWRKWSRPINLGPAINSENDENYVSVTGDLGLVYFESYPQGSTEKDIFRATFDLGQLLNPPDEEHLLAEQEQVPANTKDIAASIEGQDPATDSRVSENLVNHKPTTSTEASSVVQTMAPTNINEGEQTTASEEVQNPPATKAPSESSFARIGSFNVRQSFTDGRVKTRVLNNLYFPHDSHQISASYQGKLKEISRIMRGRSDMEAFIEGHTDNVGSEAINLRISFLRAQAAAHYLVDRGVNNNRLEIHGSGESEPLASNDDEAEGRELNRRVEITLTDAAGTHLLFILHGE